MEGVEIDLKRSQPIKPKKVGGDRFFTWCNMHRSGKASNQARKTTNTQQNNRSRSFPLPIKTSTINSQHCHWYKNNPWLNHSRSQHYSLVQTLPTLPTLLQTISNHFKPTKTNNMKTNNIKQLLSAQHCLKISFKVPNRRAARRSHWHWIQRAKPAGTAVTSQKPPNNITPL